MGKAATQAMKYEKQSLIGSKKVTGRVSRKFAASLTKDINKLSTPRILAHLYTRHEASIWITAFWVLMASVIWSKV